MNENNNFWDSLVSENSATKDSGAREVIIEQKEDVSIFEEVQEEKEVKLVSPDEYYGDLDPYEDANWKETKMPDNIKKLKEEQEENASQISKLSGLFMIIDPTWILIYGGIAFVLSLLTMCGS